MHSLVRVFSYRKIRLSGVLWIALAVALLSGAASADQLPTYTVTGGSAYFSNPDSLQWAFTGPGVDIHGFEEFPPGYVGTYSPDFGCCVGTGLFGSTEGFGTVGGVTYDSFMLVGQIDFLDGQITAPDPNTINPVISAPSGLLGSMTGCGPNWDACSQSSGVDAFTLNFDLTGTFTLALDGPLAFKDDLGGDVYNVTSQSWQFTEAAPEPRSFILLSLGFAALLVGSRKVIS